MFCLNKQSLQQNRNQYGQVESECCTAGNPFQRRICLPLGFEKIRKYNSYFKITMCMMICLAHCSAGPNLNPIPMSWTNLHSRREQFKTVGTEWFQKEVSGVHMPFLPLTTFEILGKSVNISESLFFHFNDNCNI